MSSESVAVLWKVKQSNKSPVEIGAVPAILQSFHITKDLSGNHKSYSL